MEQIISKAFTQTKKMPFNSSLIQLKMIQIQQGLQNSKKMVHEMSSMRTPSTIADFKQFHSCQLVRNNPVTEGQSKLTSHKRQGSLTSILSIRQIKTAEAKTKVMQKQDCKLQTSNSRKMIVTISKNHSNSRQKQPFLPLEEIKYDTVFQQNVKKQKIKLNIYKEIAKKNINKK